MRKLAFLLTAAAAAVTMAPAAASAAVFVPGDTGFTVVGDPFNGTVSASIGNAGIVAGAFSDTFFFTIGQSGLGSGSLSTSTSSFHLPTDLDITSVTVNGLLATKISTPQGLTEFFSITNVPILIGQLNNIVITGTSFGNGSYGGNLTFVPTAVPEAATWAMMLAGFGMIGFAVRRRSSVKTTVTYA